MTVAIPAPRPAHPDRPTRAEAAAAELLGTLGPPVPPVPPAPPAPPPRYAVAAVILQSDVDGDGTGELSVIATRLADDLRTALQHSLPDARVSATVAVASSPPAGDAGNPSDAGDAAPRSDVIVVDRSERYAAVHGRALELTYREFELLAFLTEHPGRVFTRAHLLGAVWEGALVGSRTVDVHVRRLRVKLGAEAHRLTTVRNVGYRLEPRAEARFPHGLRTVA